MLNFIPYICILIYNILICIVLFLNIANSIKGFQAYQDL